MSDLQRAWDALPSAIKAHPGIKALYRAASAPAPAPAEPVAWFCQWFNSDGSPEWDQYHDSADPLPADDEWEDRPPDRVTPLYAAPAAPAGWREAVQRLVTGFEHVSGIARQWEPDHSSGADRAKWARATEACADVVKLLAAAPGAQGDAA